ncbi:DUF2624 family protein [Halalkalibacterium ligniniphilum]|uniref:DUF2624 family protein n=1 Tax=Halalkalibacterium ligniniphilum TaxID=1134413 RepID=UPI00034AEF72|nr:DUF2624 family protein [Halalkalibacterium ligniniphilum]
MNPFMQQLVNQKINALTVMDLLQLAKQYQISLSQEQANKVLIVIHSEKIDVGNKEQVNRLIQRLQVEIDPHVSNVIAQLLKQFGHYL